MTERQLPTDSAIVEAFQTGALVDMVFQGSGRLTSEQVNKLASRCADLHNIGAIDLLSLTRPGRLAPIDPATFFLEQHFFCKAIPLLAAPAEDVMAAVSSLVDKGGQDLAANQPNAAFREWCKVDIARSQEVVDLARGGHSLATKLLTFALEAWSLADEAMALLADQSDDVRLSAATALGRMNLEGQETERLALRRLDATLDSEVDEQLASNVLVAAVSITGSSEVDLLQESLRIAQRVSAIGGCTILQSCAYALSAHGQTLPAEVVDVLLEALAAANPSDEGVTQRLDNALQALLESEHRDRALEFVRRLLTTGGDLFTTAHFEYFANRLKSEPRDLLWQVLLNWLLSGERVLCEWVPALTEAGPDADEPLDLPASMLQLTETEKIFLARKVIGYLFLRPVCCASILVSILRTCEVGAGEAISELLFDPMLVNYSGGVREYLEALLPSDPAYRAARRALGNADALSAELPPVNALKELHPSEYERQIEHQLTSDQMSAAFRRTQRDSVLLSLAHRSVLLYGRRSLVYFQVPGQPRQACEAALQPYGVAFEMPRVQVLDPVGLVYMLRVFRAETLTP